jgi:hypothetical protein
MSKIIIAGSRRLPALDITEYHHWNDPDKRYKVYNILEELIFESKLEITTVISGTCWGMDKLGEEWALTNNVPIISMPAEWKKYGKGAGPIRNTAMAKIGDALICILAEGSRGAQHMVDTMTKMGKPTFYRVI